MKNLQTTVKTYTISERAQIIYQTVVDIFDYTNTNEIVTPLSVVEEQVKELANPESIYLVPGAGIGTYVAALIKYGATPGNIYAVEISPAFERLGRRIFNRFGVNYVCADFLTWCPKMEFDVIVGNPPYQRLRDVRNTGAPLWPQFISKSMSLLKKDGILDFLVPATWMNRKLRGAWKFIAPYDLVYVDPDVKKFFPGVGGNGGTFSRLKLANRPYGGVTSVGGKFEINFHTEEIPENNRMFTSENLMFLQQIKDYILPLSVKSGPINPSINSEHWSPEKTITHIYETYYSGDPKRRSIWCDQPVGDYGKLKLVVASSGSIYETCEITSKGVGRQANYVMGTREELVLLRGLMLQEKSKLLCELKTAGNFTNPLSCIVK